MIGAIFVLLYARFSKVGLSEFAVGAAFGPLLFEGCVFRYDEKFFSGGFNTFICCCNVYNRTSVHPYPAGF